MKRLGRIPGGMIAGACGTAALNMLTYLDMAARGRPASPVPAQAAEKMAEGAGIELAGDGDEDTKANRSQGLGALMGYGAGLGAGLLYPAVGARMERWPLAMQAAALALGAMLAGNVPAAGMGITDPREWSGTDWLADVVPHAVYGLVTAAVYQSVRR